MNKSIILEISENNVKNSSKTAQSQLIANLFVKHDEIEKPLNQQDIIISSHSDIFDDWKTWQTAYLQCANNHKGTRVQTIRKSISRETKSLKICQEKADQLKVKFNQWLDFEDFAPIKEQIKKELNQSNAVEVLIRTDNVKLRKLPWHLWDVFKGVEVILSYTKAKHIERPNIPRQKVQILAILGNDKNIKKTIKDDKEFLETLPNAEIKFLNKPSRSKLYEAFYNPNGWDIIFFSGHSETTEDGTKGFIEFNNTEKISIAELGAGLEVHGGPGVLLVAIRHSNSG